MKTQNNHNKLVQLIVSLIQLVAEINTLRPDSYIQDTVVFQDEEHKTHAHTVASRSTGDEGSWIFTDREKPKWDEVVRKLCDLNPKIVSPRKVDDMLYKFTSQYFHKQWSLSGLRQDAEALISSIGNEQGRTAKVFLPIWGLITRVSPFVIGEVDFKARRECPEVEEKLAKFESALQVAEWGKIHTIAQTESSGVDDMLRQNAEVKVNRALNIFRAFTQPIVQDPAFKQIGIMGTFYTSEALYWVEGPRVSTGVLPRLLSGGYVSSGVSDRLISQYLAEYVLADQGFYKVSDFLKAPPKGLKGGLLRGAEWLGEATKPDTLESKFLKVAFAVDAMVGEVAEDIPDRGKKARIAERSAFLLSDEPSERLQIYKEMRDFINKRDGLAHGSEEEVSQWETENFGMRARKLLTTLLRDDYNFKTTKQLADWVLLQSFNNGSELDTSA